MKLKRTRLAGGTGGQIFGAYLIPKGTFLSAVYVHAGDVIDGLQLETTDRTETRGLLPFIGGVGGRRIKFRLSAREKVIGITGRSGIHINSIQFHTTNGSSPLFGSDKGTPFVLKVDEDGEFKGVYGRAGWFLDSIGLIQANDRDNARSLVIERTHFLGKRIAKAGEHDPTLEVPKAS
ncbi:MAG: jacalin-like lectin [Verrucomicrobiota bacterium]